jgi:ABC-type transport system substrate-binding protein
VETPVLSFEQEEWKYAASMDEAKELLDDAGYALVEEEINFDGGESREEEGQADESQADETEDVSEDVIEETPEEDSSEEESAEEEEVETPVPEDSGETRVVRKNPGGDVLEFRLVARLYPEGSYKYNEINTVINYLEKQWDTAGITVSVELYDATTLQEIIRTRDYDLLLFGQSLGYNQDLYGYWHSTQAGESGLNLSNYKSFAVDTLIEQIRTTFDDEEKESLARTLAETIQADTPAIFLYRPVYYYASDGKVKGLDLQNMAFPADRFCSVADWFLN